MAKYQVIIGRAEELDIVGTSISVPAKIDTGAYRSSIHATDIKLVIVDGKKILKFCILGHKNSPIKRQLQSDHFELVDVRSSNGQVAERYWVKLKVKIANKIFYTSFTLTDRSSNVYPILIGRNALSGRFIVDVTKAGFNTENMLKAFGISKKDFGEEY